MTSLERFDAARLKSAVLIFRDALKAHQEAINRLNVYPVPDGDTGTNMTLTMEAVASELNGAEAMNEVCKAISHGSLMGARGNSGVILSQILRGIADIVGAGRDAGPVELAAAFASASDAAYEAVMRPVEGTILTVVRATADGAKAAAGDGLDLVATLEAARALGADALEKTPEMLPVLKQAGVVDAGGTGFLLFLDACLNVADGRALPEPPAQLAEPDLEGMEDALADVHDTVSDLRYEVMYFLEAPDATIGAFKEVWAGIGDSIVVVGGDGIWNCHIHTDDIGAAVEAAIDCGRPRNIRVTDLMEQVEEERWVRDAASAPPEEVPAHEPVPTAVVAVATGDGIRRIFRSLGVQQIVAGGQSMNPSTAQILEAVEAAPADEVVVLPNNKNIIPVAEQVGELTTKTVRVVKTTGIAEGFAALIEYDPEATADANFESMTDASSRILSGEVTRAVRDSVCDVGPIAEGDFLGLTLAGIRVVSPVLAEVCTGLLAELLEEAREIVTVIEGDGASAAATRRITEWLHEHHPEVAHEVHHGGQPLYPYLFSVE
ncbi:MAG: fatty acid kinase [Actinomycetota bacterium]|nr:fatty acid kinase [Actinomycetota bacterium]